MIGHPNIQTDKQKLLFYIYTRLLGHFAPIHYLNFSWCGVSIFPGVTWGPTQNMGPIGSVVLTFIGYKQTNTQTRKYIDKFHLEIKVLTLNSSIKGKSFSKLQWQSLQVPDVYECHKEYHFAMVITL